MIAAISTLIPRVPPAQSATTQPARGGHRADPQLHNGNAKDLHQHEQQTPVTNHQRLQRRPRLQPGTSADGGLTGSGWYKMFRGRPIDAVEARSDKFGDERRPEEEEGSHPRSGRAR